MRLLSDYSGYVVLVRPTVFPSLRPIALGLIGLLLLSGCSFLPSKHVQSVQKVVVAAQKADTDPAQAEILKQQALQVQASERRLENVRSGHWFSFHRKSKPALVQYAPNLPAVDFNEPIGIKERYKPHGFGLGAWILRSDGPKFLQSRGSTFQPISPQSNKSAIVYLYRPHSDWGYQEIIAPSFFLNGQRLPNLIDNQYYWLELPAGQYRLSIRRPIGFIYFQQGTTADFKVEGGQTYYLRYDETHNLSLPDQSLGLLRVDDLAQVTPKIAQNEIGGTVMSQAGQSFVPSVDNVAPVQLPAFDGQPRHEVSKTQLTQKEAVTLGTPLVLWNPLTW